MNNNLKQEETSVGRYIAIGLLLAFLFNFIALGYILVTGNTHLFSLVIVFNKNYPTGLLPNSGVGGGWTSGPLFFLFIVLGGVGGWGYYKIKMMMQDHRKR